MKRTIGLVVCVLLLVAADEKDKDKEKKADDKKAESKKVEKKTDDSLQGTWTVTALSTNGKEDKVTPEHRLVFKDGRLTTKVGNRVLTMARYKVDPGQKPAAIDVTPTSGVAAGRTLKGIYQVKGDELKYALAMGDLAERPTELGPTPFVLYYVLKRDK